MVRFGFSAAVAAAMLLVSGTAVFSQGIEQETLPDLSTNSDGTQGDVPEGDTVAPSEEQPEVLEAPQGEDVSDTAEGEDDTDVEILEAPTLNAEPAPIAEVRALDKITGQLETFDMRVGETYRYERLTIRLDSCQVFPKKQDAVMFVEIADDKMGDQPAFTGWMFSSSPALSAMDHPRYDVWLLNCKTDSGDADVSSEEKSAE